MTITLLTYQFAFYCFSKLYDASLAGMVSLDLKVNWCKGLFNDSESNSFQNRCSIQQLQQICFCKDNDRLNILTILTIQKNNQQFLNSIYQNKKKVQSKPDQRDMRQSIFSRKLTPGLSIFVVALVHHFTVLNV